MATLNISVSYSDAQQQRILDGLRFYYTYTSPVGTEVIPTSNEIQERIKKELVKLLKEHVLAGERLNALKTQEIPTIG